MTPATPARRKNEGSPEGRPHSGSPMTCPRACFPSKNDGKMMGFAIKVTSFYNEDVTVVFVPLGRNVDSNHENMADHGICNHDQPSV